MRFEAETTAEQDDAVGLGFGLRVGVEGLGLDGCDGRELVRSGGRQSPSEAMAPVRLRVGTWGLGKDMMNRGCCHRRAVRVCPQKEGLGGVFPLRSGANP